VNRTTLAVVALIAALAGAALYLQNASYETQLAELRKQLEQASQREAASAAAAKAAYMSAVETAVAEAKAQAGKAAAERAAAQRAAAEARSTAEKLAAQRAALEAEAKAAAAGVAEAKARFEEAKKKADEARVRAEEAKKRADDARASADRLAAERAPAGPTSAQMLYEQALALEEQGKGGEAVKAYIRAARSGSGRAALRLGEIYDKGIPGVSRDYPESLKWYNAARVLGEDVPLFKTR